MDDERIKEDFRRFLEMDVVAAHDHSYCYHCKRSILPDQHQFRNAVVEDGTRYEFVYCGPECAEKSTMEVDHDYLEKQSDD